MDYLPRLAIAITASLLLHALLDAAVADAEPPPKREAYRVTMAIHRPTPPAPVEEPPAITHAPEPAVAPVAPPEPPKVIEDPIEAPDPPKQVVEKKKKKRKKKRKPDKQVTKAQTTRETPATTPSDSTPSAGPTRHRFGVSLKSTSAAGTGAALPTGNSLDPGASRSGPMGGGGGKKPGAGAGPSGPSGGGGPAAAVETVTRMPRIKGTCRGRYTPQAKAAGVEGTVVLSTTIGADGRARDIAVVRGLGLGLDESAKKALAACRFKPGIKAGKPVAVRLRSFKIRYVLDRR